MDYLFSGKLDNTVHDISYEQIKEMYIDNLREEAISKQMTESSYRGESYFNTNLSRSEQFDKEFLERIPRTSGGRCYYPHGVIIQQGGRRNYYRGENQIYPQSVPSLLRAIKSYTTKREKELYRLVADMRIAEFSLLLQKFQHVREWAFGDVLYEPLAQHYGLETGWLDITSDFNVALFFATCFWEDGQWKPLTKKQTEVDEKHQYGMIFHMPSKMMQFRWLDALEKLKPWTDEEVGETDNGNPMYGKLEHPIYRGDVDNIVYPIGFQPFMRCHMQYGYGIYMRTPHPLQEDNAFEKLRFRHSEKLSQSIFDLMEGGKKIYPHEGLKEANYIIDQIRGLTTFSKKAFDYALYHSHMFRMRDAEQVLQELKSFRIGGNEIRIVDQSPWRISSGRRKRIEKIYQDFSVEKWYGIRIMNREVIPGARPFFEPWMLPEDENEEGIKDFRLRESVNCSDSIAARNATSDHYTLRHFTLADF